MKNYINSYDKEKFVMGKIYWTFYMDLSYKKGDQIRNYTGVFAAVPTKESWYSEQYKSFKWILSELKAVLSQNQVGNLQAYLNGYGIASCDFFDTKEEAMKVHDERIKEYARGQDTRKRATMYRKLYDKKDTPPKSKIETESMEWLKTLSKKEIEYVSWIKYYFEGINEFL
jgi:hypothetical protein